MPSLLQRNCTCTRTQHSSVAVAYKINPPISRRFSVLTWANSKQSLLDLWTHGALWLFSILLVSFFCTDEWQLLHKCLCYSSSLWWAALQLKSRARYPLAVFSLLQLERCFSLLDGQRPASCWVNSASDRHQDLHCPHEKHPGKKNKTKQNSGSESQWFLLSAQRQQRDAIYLIFWLLSLKITARIHLSWKAIRLPLERTQAQHTCQVRGKQVTQLWWDRFLWDSWRKVGTVS